MQLSEMIVEARSMINQTDPNNSQITNAQLTAWANEGYRMLVTRLGALPETPYDLTSATGDIPLDTSILTLLRCNMYMASSGKYSPLAIIGVDALETIDPQWLSATAGTPYCFVRKSTFTGYLYPQPDTANTGQTIKLDTIAFPTDLSGDTDTPDLPKNLQDLIPHYMARRAFQQMGQDAKATDALIYINSNLKADRQVSAKFSGQSNVMLWSGCE